MNFVFVLIISKKSNVEKSEAEAAFQTKPVFCFFFAKEEVLNCKSGCNAGSNLKSVRKDNIYFRTIKEREKIRINYFITKQLQSLCS